MPGDPAVVTGTTGIPANFDSSRVSFQWFATGLKISGTGNTATIITDNASPGTYTVVGHASVGRNLAECSTTLTIRSFDVPAISCSVDPASVTLGESVSITTNAARQQNRPLHYSYSATSGSVTGSGPTATLSTVGASSGTIHVICNAVDDRGLSSSASTSVIVVAVGATPTTAGAVPAFPSSPPKASARTPLPQLHLANGKIPRTLGEIDGLLSAALNRTGYGTKGYYSFPGGFALATRLEQIFPDGRSMPPPSRFSTAPPLPQVFSLDYFKGIFIAREGYFRVIVFIVTDQAFIESTNAPSKETAVGWPNAGTNVLPPNIAKIAAPKPPDVVVTALIYEFRNSTGGNVSNFTFLDTNTLAPNEQLLDGKVHLEKSGLWSALQLH